MEYITLNCSVSKRNPIIFKWKISLDCSEFFLRTDYNISFLLALLMIYIVHFLKASHVGKRKIFENENKKLGNIFFKWLFI